MTRHDQPEVDRIVAMHHDGVAVATIIATIDGPAAPTRVLTAAEPEAWRTRAKCPENFDLFHPPGESWKHQGAQAKRALAICHRCPVEMPCRDWILSIRDKFAIAGGMTPRQRRAHLEKLARLAKEATTR